MLGEEAGWGPAGENEDVTTPLVDVVVVGGGIVGLATAHAVTRA